jgi:PAS domain-containing protein
MRVLVLSDVILVIVVVGLTLYAVHLLPIRSKAPPVSVIVAEHEPLALLFDDGFLHHATQRALSQLAINPSYHVWSDLRDCLLTRFPDLPEIPGSGEFGSMTLTAQDQISPRHIEMTWRGSLCWITFVESDDRPALQHGHEDIAALHRTAHANPHPVWHVDADGEIIWENGAYRTLRDQTHKGIEPLFETPVDDMPHRANLPCGANGSLTHYTITRVEIDGILVCHATCINDLVAAKKAKRNFFQTLSKTFAHLPIGLAIFDRNGQLAIFNPALVELSCLSAPFLSRQPIILSFFDQMRENRQMPEPKNYNAWRQEISNLVTAATDGLYQETWTLED